MIMIIKFRIVNMKLIKSIDIQKIFFKKRVYCIENVGNPY